MDFQEAHLISVELIYIKMGEKNLFLCPFNPIVTMLVLRVIMMMSLQVQLNLDYPDSLGPHEIVRITENMNITEEQN